MQTGRLCADPSLILVRAPAAWHGKSTQARDIQLKQDAPSTNVFCSPSNNALVLKIFDIEKHARHSRWLSISLVPVRCYRVRGRHCVTGTATLVVARVQGSLHERCILRGAIIGVARSIPLP